MEKTLGYKYPYIHRNRNKLKEMDLVTLQPLSTGDRIRKLVELNFRGMTLFLLAWKDYTKEAKKSIKTAITKHPELFPFSKQWSEIEEIVGEELLLKKLIVTASDVVNGNHVELQIDHLNLRFQAFIYSFVHPGFFPPETSFKGKERIQKFADFLVSQDELKKSYISFLAIQDTIDLAQDRLEIHELERFRSERELTFFEKRKIADNPLFPRERLGEIFPKYTEMKYVFTGSLMNRLLWKKAEKPTPETKKGFHVHFPKGVVVTPIT